MTEEAPAGREDAYRFIREEIDTIPHLEALLLIWGNQLKLWCLEDIAKELYISQPAAHQVLEGLVRRGLLAVRRSEEGEYYAYSSTSARRSGLMEAVSLTYRRELIPVSKLIHSKGTGAMRSFADAFRFTKERDRE